MMRPPTARQAIATQSAERRTEFGEVIPKGAANAARLIAIVEDAASGLPDEARPTLLVLIETETRLDDQIGKLDAEIRRRAKENEVARRLMTIPPLGHGNIPCQTMGIRPLIATALVALAPPHTAATAFDRWKAASWGGATTKMPYR